MVAQVEIMSKETIKPSSPTPDHHKELKFSFPDQIAVPVFVSFVFFYQLPKDDINHKNNIVDFNHQAQILSDQLKKSLSDTLTLFYPVAGRIHKNSSIICDDSGVQFIEARVRNARLLEILETPDLDEIKNFLPLKPDSHHPSEEQMLLSVQINFFDDCEGIAIGICMSHKIADATSRAEFMRAWAANCRGASHEISPPIFGLTASHFPSVDRSALTTSSPIRFAEGKFATKRLVLTKENLDTLKSRISAAPDSDLNDPSRVEAASAYIWKQLIHAAARKRKTKNESHDATADHTKTSVAVGRHVVGLRPRMDPPFPLQAFGNCTLVASTFFNLEHHLKTDDDGIKLHDLAGQLRTSIRKLDGEYIKQVQVDEEGYYKKEYLPAALITQGEFGGHCTFTSWSRIPLYEVDFGWGKPVWVCSNLLPYKNVVILLPTRDGDGLEAWFSMLEDDMRWLQLE